MKIPRTHEDGGGQLVGLAFLVVLVLLWVGAQGVYTAIRNRNPASMSLAAFAQKLPDVDWLELSDALPAVLEASYGTHFGQVNEAYIPLRVPGAGPDEKVVVVMVTKDEALLDLLLQWEALGRSRRATFQEQHAKEFTPAPRVVSGLVRFGIDLKSRERERLAGIVKNLDPSFALIEEGKKPQLLGSILMLAAGMLGGGFWLWRQVRRPKPPPPPEEPKGLPPLPTPPKPPGL